MIRSKRNKKILTKLWQRECAKGRWLEYKYTRLAFFYIQCRAKGKVPLAVALRMAKLAQSQGEKHGPILELNPAQLMHTLERPVYLEDEPYIEPEELQKQAKSIEE